MPEATHTITGRASTPIARLTGETTETSAVYGQADLDRRLAEAREQGIEVDVTPISD